MWRKDGCFRAGGVLAFVAVFLFFVFVFLSACRFVGVESRVGITLVPGTTRREVLMALPHGAVGSFLSLFRG